MNCRLEFHYNEEELSENLTGCVKMRTLSKATNISGINNRLFFAIDFKGISFRRMRFHFILLAVAHKRNNYRHGLTNALSSQTLGTSIIESSEIVTLQESFSIRKEDTPVKKIRFKKLFKDDRHQNLDEQSTTYKFTYNYNVLEKPYSSESGSQLCVLLIPPIGVGIGRWYYDRLLKSLATGVSSQDCQELYFLAPDLLASGSAAQPSIIGSNKNVERLPLFQVRDWSSQLISLMQSYDSSISKNSGLPIEWCIVSNGGCSPIALDIAHQSLKYNDKFDKFGKNSVPRVTSVILSAPPRLSFFLNPSSPIEKIMSSYKTLCGIAGKAFWWYALRKKGKFLQSFSEKNLAASAETLGPDWQSKCYETAKSNNGMSKYSTFAFLAGSLNGGCKEILQELGQAQLPIDIISGGDRRKNPARR